MIRIAVLAFLVMMSVELEAQFKAIYPIGEKPSFGWKSGMTDKETIIFEAEPIVRYSFHNRIKQSLDSLKMNDASAYYISVRPQLRMYTDNSVPVKMPSYRVLLGYQYFRKLSSGNQLAVSLESGHYSNGQSGCTYDANLDDASDACHNLYETILNPDSNLSEHLNRKNGEFSTDLTELIFNYRLNNFNIEKVPLNIHSIQIGMTYYHNHFLGFLPFGGFSENDIKIYGRLRTMASYEFFLPLNYSELASLGKYLNRIELKQSVEIIHGAHTFVNPIRLETVVSLYLQNNVGFFMKFTHGHDNYNIRFVDSGNEFSFGVSWSIFPISEMLKPTISSVR